MPVNEATRGKEHYRIRLETWARPGNTRQDSESMCALSERQLFSAAVAGEIQVGVDAVMYLLPSRCV